MSVRVVIQNDIQIEIPNNTLFQSWVDTTQSLIQEQIPESVNEICIRIVDKAESAYLNKTYRQKEGPTNVLSFSYSDITDSLGDLAICAEVVKTEANNQHKSVEAHWAHMTIHGMLHLLGYDHLNQKDADIMESLEIQILKKLGYPNPYQENKQEHIIDER